MNESNDWARRELVKTATRVIAGQVDLVSGCRELSKLLRSVCPVNSSMFNAIISFESETDDYPLGEVRSTYERTYIENLDKELLNYSNRMRSNILNDCQRIVAEYSLPQM